MRLAAVDRERRAARRAYDLDSESEAQARRRRARRRCVAGKPETAEGRARLDALADDVIDGRDRIALAERELLVPLDAKARALILESAKRVSVVTAVSPKAIVDIAYVLFETVRLIRRMSELYGARPGTIGLIRLTRDVVGPSRRHRLDRDRRQHRRTGRRPRPGRAAVGPARRRRRQRPSDRPRRSCRDGPLPAPAVPAGHDGPRIGDFVGDLMRLAQDEKGSAKRSADVDAASGPAVGRMR